jgi:hypothetical protein
MKKMNPIITGLVFLAILSTFAFGADDRTDVENVIKSSYFNGAFNDLESQARMDCKIASLDITAECAAAKIEISKNGKMIYTDYLSLLKFGNGWKIVAKVYHAHPRQDR